MQPEISKPGRSNRLGSERVHAMNESKLRAYFSYGVSAPTPSLLPYLLYIPLLSIERKKSRILFICSSLSLKLAGH